MDHSASQNFAIRKAMKTMSFHTSAESEERCILLTLCCDVAVVARAVAVIGGSLKVFSYRICIFG